MSPQARAAAAPISVVVPTYNRAAVLETSLESLHRAREGLEVELVVVDDGSSDETPERLRDAAKRIPELQWTRVPNGGPARARNRGAAMASHDVVLFLGDDIRPCGRHFLRAHAELHAERPERDLAVLGKVVWPGGPGEEVTHVMRHITGRRGEQFGYADLSPCTLVDWRFFYTANVSVKRSLVGDWEREGFSGDFTRAAWEDAELAYRLRKQGRPLRIFYTPASVGTHHHSFSVDDFMRRQRDVGAMARVFLERHPEAARELGVAEVLARLRRSPTEEDERRLPDLLALLEGIKAWARLVEAHSKLGSQPWHDDLLFGVFQLCALQGFVASWPEPGANHGAAYRWVLDEFVSQMRYAVQTEFSGYALGALDPLEAPRSGTDVAQRVSRLRRWARSKPWLRGLYRALRSRPGAA